MQKYVYLFKEGSAAMRAKLGLKGSRLSEMFRMGIPVPPGLVISTDSCAQYFEYNRTHVPEMQEQLKEKMEILEKSLGQHFGCERDPLLLSIRPSAEVQMPGILKDLCNVGLNDKSVAGLARLSGNERFAWDTYRRYIEDLSVRAMNINTNRLQSIREKFLKGRASKRISDMTADEIKALVQEYMKVIHRYTGRRFPQDPEEQLWLAIDSLYAGWRSEAAMTYRRMNDLTHLRGTGLTIQKMAFGNVCSGSAAGRLFTRNPLTGEKGMFGEYAMNSTLEEIIGGQVTPRSVSDLKLAMPKIYDQLEGYYQKLERHFQDVQDIQFVVENGKLSLLYSKNARMGAEAEVKCAVDFANEGLASRTYILKNVYAPLFGYLHHKVVDKQEAGKAKLLGKGISGSLASATGQVLFNKNKAKRWCKEGKHVILITKEATTEDYVALSSVCGYVTQIGGTTSDAAILIREKSVASVLSCGDLEIDGSLASCKIGGNVIKEGDTVTVNGADGAIYAGAVPLVDSELPQEYPQLLEWADGFKHMRVLVNADTPEEAMLGLKYGAEGIGLCKSEHMFNNPAKLRQIRKAILSETDDERKRVLSDLVSLHKEDFKAIFRVMSGKPCMIRILDPPLNTFVPADPKSQAALAAELDIPVETVVKHYNMLAQYNPTLGLRGSRIAFVYPEFVQFEVSSIFMAALEAVEEGIVPMLHIILPMISSAREFTLVKRIVDEVAMETGALQKIKYRVGMLIEIPRAALAADQLAREADFMHFGTNDLTQLACGFSQEDSKLLIQKYVENGVYAKDPFVTIDTTSVGELMRMSIEKARKVKKGIRFGISGLQASDPVSIGLCQKMGVNELSCLAQRVPVAKIAAAQAALEADDEAMGN